MSQNAQNQNSQVKLKYWCIVVSSQQESGQLHVPDVEFITDSIPTTTNYRLDVWNSIHSNEIYTLD